MPAGTSLKHISRLKKNNNWKMFSDFLFLIQDLPAKAFGLQKFFFFDKKVGHRWSSG
jgi:hypothetical protein